MKYINYTKLGDLTTPGNYPQYPSDLWEIDASAGKLLACLDDDTTYIWSTEDKGITWAKEVQGTAGGFVAIESYHDRDNSKLYLMELTAGNNGETFVVDYSTWATITITKHNGDTGDVLASPFQCDVFLRDSNLEMIFCNGAQIDARRYNNPWASIDTNPDNISRMGRVVVVGTTVYFYGDITAANTIGMYSFDGATVDTLDTIAATSYIDELGAKNMAYDGDDTIYFIAKDDGTGDNYLYSYAITADTITKRGVSDYFFMADRDTASGVKEKAWAWATNDFNVYQLHDVLKHQLHKIAKPEITAGYKIYCLTDNFLWAKDADSEIWEYEDKIRKLISVDMVHEIMEPPGGDVTLKRDVIPLENNMIMKFLDNYTSGDVPILYRGTYNFKDDADGAEPAGWTTNNGASCTTIIITELDDHKKVLEFDDQNGAGLAQIYRTITQTADQTIEFWLGKDSIAGNTNLVFLLYEGGTRIIYWIFQTNDLVYYDGGWHTINNILTANKLFHFKIILDDTANTYDVWIDGVSQGTLDYENNTTTSIDTIRIQTDNADTGYKGYIDALGFSGESDYDVGDNLTVDPEEKVIFEGVIYKHTETENQTVNLESLAEIDLDTKPSGDYAGRSDEIITSLITDYCNYITKGTFSSGTAMGTITFAGEKTLGTILDELAYFENWIWYLTPTGVLYYNNGTVDSLVNLSEADNVHFVIPTRPKEIYNRIKIKGAYVDGVQVESAWQEDLESQQTIGIKPRTFTFGFLNTTALCNTAATNVLTRLGKEPLSVNFTHQDENIGFMQPGETITFEFNRGGIIVSSDQFLITEVIYIDQSVGIYTIRDELP